MSDWISEMEGLALGSRMRRFSDYLSSEIKAVYKAKGIDFNPRHFPVVSLICAHSSELLSIRELAEETGLTHSSISQTVTKLESIGFCTRETDPRDERAIIVRPTSVVLEFVENELTPIWQAIKQVTNDCLPDQSIGFWQTLEEAEEVMQGEPLSRKILKHLANSK
ncbi:MULTISPECIES: MarR family winged helix-turn-helix transcriptional regulator [unclassified Marinomonas]|uniref:MarR family winged helix-turn-helix transcriptional regulator n=1 Tax=unclassified Marinomonas TaxID=196814 RepID=UPI0007AFCE30|nr:MULTISPECIES: MarR family transcriptional regulator [unclassified Marinomonas]